MRQDTVLHFRELPVIDEMIMDEGQSQHSRPLTPYQVLRMLPRDATPAQQDSAIQACFQPGEIHYSEQPDTLHLPGHGPGRDLTDVDLPQYYRENFFSKNSAFHTEAGGGLHGVAGDPVPYTIRGDNMFTALLLLCIVMFFFSIARSQWFIGRQLKDFFYMPHEEDLMTETSGELRFQFFLVLMGCMLASISFYLYVTTCVADVFLLDSNIQLIALFFVCFVGYFLLKGGLYTLVNRVFFDSKRNLHWNKSVLFLAAVESSLILPVVLLQVYFDLNIQNVVFYYIFLLLFIKILTFYKCWIIFFRQNGVFLQIFLYFCALEVTPVLGFAGALMLIIDSLKINF